MAQLLLLHLHQIREERKKKNNGHIYLTTKVVKNELGVC
jgi:hypothetical protein